MKVFASSLSGFLRSKECPYTQAFKYMACGVVSLAVDQIVFYLLAWLVLPCLRASDPVARLIIAVGLPFQEASELELKSHYWIIKVICFVLSISTAYVLNVLFVFHAGRHRRPVEIIMFFGFSLLQFVYIWLGGVLISRYGWEVTYANYTMLFLGVATNYFARKKIVFKG
jgi:putative flippase GtrA